MGDLELGVGLIRLLTFPVELSLCTNFRKPSQYFQYDSRSIARVNSQCPQCCQVAELSTRAQETFSPTKRK